MARASHTTHKAWAAGLGAAITGCLALFPPHSPAWVLLVVAAAVCTGVVAFYAPYKPRTAGRKPRRRRNQAGQLAIGLVEILLIGILLVEVLWWAGIRPH